MNTIQIVGTLGEDSIALPIPFPAPIVGNGARQVRNVMITPGVHEEKSVLLSQFRAYELGRSLAEAIYGHVRHGVLLERSHDNLYLRSGTHVAIKFYDKSKIRKLAGRTQENPVNEIAAMQFLNSGGVHHPNIIRLIEVLQDDSFVYCVMEYLNGGELYHKLDVSGAFDEPQARSYFLQTLSGFSFMQERGICHRDMSLENLLITNDGRVVIIDFGMSLRLPRHPTTDQICLIPPQGRCGKLNYIAPEILSNTRPFNGFLSDTWGMGVILFILLTGVPPFDSASPLDARYRMIREGRLSELLAQWEITLSPHAEDLLQGILREEPNNRLTTEQIQQHPWVTNTI